MSKYVSGSGTVQRYSRRQYTLKSNLVFGLAKWNKSDKTLLKTSQAKEKLCK